MKKNILFLLTLCLFAHATIQAAGEHLLFTGDEEKGLIINNRILAKVNGKAISVYDVMKKMDLLFYRSFPEYTSSIMARYQFYQVNWQGVLRDLIDKELILADSEENKLQVSSGDVRQEMETLFGPNIIANLDSVGMTFDEAWKIVHGDIVIKRMMYIRTTSKVLKQVTPQNVRDAYEIYAKENVRPEQWVYSVVTIRDKDKDVGAVAAEHIYTWLATENVPLKEVIEKAAQTAYYPPSAKVTISEEYQHEEKQMSTAYKTILAALEPGKYSRPAAQKSRQGNETVYRIFYLKEFQPGGAPSFNEVAKTLKEKLLEEAAEKETVAYIKKLRKHFDVQEIHPEELDREKFEPFKLGPLP
jgi:hypothetical protein